MSFSLLFMRFRCKLLSACLSWLQCASWAMCAPCFSLSFSLSLSSPSHTISVFLSSEGLSHSPSHSHHSSLPSSHPLDSLPPTLLLFSLYLVVAFSSHAAPSGYSSSHSRLYLLRKREWKIESERGEREREKLEGWIPSLCLSLYWLSVSLFLYCDQSAISIITCVVGPCLGQKKEMHKCINQQAV